VQFQFADCVETNTTLFCAFVSALRVNYVQGWLSVRCSLGGSVRRQSGAKRIALPPPSIPIKIGLYLQQRANNRIDNNADIPKAVHHFCSLAALVNDIPSKRIAARFAGQKQISKTR
jgi:hypothetical protein